MALVCIALSASRLRSFRIRKKGAREKKGTLRRNKKEKIDFEGKKKTGGTKKPWPQINRF